MADSVRGYGDMANMIFDLAAIIVVTMLIAAVGDYLLRLWDRGWRRYWRRRNRYRNGSWYDTRWRE